MNGSQSSACVSRAVRLVAAHSSSQINKLRHPKYNSEKFNVPSCRRPDFQGQYQLHPPPAPLGRMDKWTESVKRPILVGGKGRVKRSTEVSIN